MNIFLEGPDGAGKSTLAAELVHRLGNIPAFHYGPHVGVGSEELCWVFHRGLETEPGILRLHDRCWLSEPIYASTFRQHEGSRVDRAQQRALERQAGRSLVILCRPPFDVCLKTFEARKGEEYLDNGAQLLMVHAKYATLNQQTNMPVLEYDYTKDSFDDLLYVVMRHITKDMRKPKVLIVGEQANVRDGDHIGRRAPFTAYSKVGCSWWLNNMLDQHAIPEQELYWLNARDERGQPQSDKALHQMPATINHVVALGSVAAKWCAEHRLNAHVIRHPQHHKRFEHGETYPLPALLKELIHAHS